MLAAPRVVNRKMSLLMFLIRLSCRGSFLATIGSKRNRLSRLKQALQAADDGRPAVVDATECGRILLDVLRQQVLVNQAEFDLRTHRREFVGDARKAVAFFGDFRLVLLVPGI